MSPKSSFTKIVFSLLLILSLSVLTLADTIRLKDGSIIKGRIVGFSGGRFTVAIGEGSRLKQLTYSAAEIESISFDTASDRPPVTTAKQTSDGATIINTSSTTPLPPRVITTDATVRPGVPSTTGTSPRVKPIEWSVKVLADATNSGWTNSGWVLKKGQKIRITGDGQVSLGKGKTSPASGIGDLADDQKLLKNVPTGALIAVIGDDNNDFIYIGAEREFTATRDGSLFLGINEGVLDDNSGSYNVKIEILPNNIN